MAMRRLRHENGFTLVEMLIALVVLAALIAIAVPSYLGFSGRAEKRTAAADVRSALASAEAYHSDRDTYSGMGLASLQGYDSGIQVDDVVVSSDGRTYCLDKAVGTQKAYAIRGAAPHTPSAPGSDAGQVDDTGLCPATISNTSN